MHWRVRFRTRAAWAWRGGCSQGRGRSQAMDLALWRAAHPAPWAHGSLGVSIREMLREKDPPFPRTPGPLASEGGHCRAQASPRPPLPASASSSCGRHPSHLLGPLPPHPVPTVPLLTRELLGVVTEALLAPGWPSFQKGFLQHLQGNVRPKASNLWGAGRVGSADSRRRGAIGPQGPVQRWTLLEHFLYQVVKGWNFPLRPISYGLRAAAGPAVAANTTFNEAPWIFRYSWQGVCTPRRVSRRSTQAPTRPCRAL